ncbi:MAG: transglycosylase SLT domain-containing protein [Reichenbachiella sp.]|uniref:transglycosylase SLT domain-containing protein n=1 Tax=Reichenbachiella sp. TaxID=2184521 RepID=UPI00329A3781
MASKSDILKEASKYDAKYGFPDGFIASVIKIESAFNVNAERQESGGRYSMGLMQVLRGGGAVDEYEKIYGQKSDEFFYNWKNNIKVGSWYLGEKIGSYLDRFKHDHTVENYVIAYNAGIGNLNKYKKTGSLPSYTKKYLEKMQSNGIPIRVLAKGAGIFFSCPCCHSDLQLSQVR